MADLFNNLALGLAVALSLKNLMLCFLGCLVGTLIGVLPGVGPIATITMLLPITFGIDPTGALIMLAGIYYGPIWRLDHVDPCQHPRRSDLGCDLPRWPPDGQAGSRGRRPRHRRHRFFHRRVRRNARDRGARLPADAHGAAVWSGRLFRTDGAGPDVCRGAGARLGVE